jgi:hypothetical protein
VNTSLIPKHFGINKNVLMTTIMFVACIKVIYAAAQQET